MPRFFKRRRQTKTAKPKSFFGKVFYFLLGGLGPRASTLALVILAGAFFYGRYGPKPLTVPPIKQRVGDCMVNDAVEQFPWGKEVGTVFMPPVENDWGRFFTDRLRDRIEANGRFQLLPESTWEKIAKDLNRYPSPRYDQDLVSSLLRETKANTVLIGRVRTYQEDAKSAVGELNLVFMRKSGDAIPIHVSKELKKSILNPEYLAFIGFRFTSFGQRLFAWFLVVLLFPMLLAPVTIKATRRESSYLNLTLVMLYSLMLIVWTVLILGPIVAWWQGLMMIVASLLIIGYVALACEMLAGMAEGRRSPG